MQDGLPQCRIDLSEEDILRAMKKIRGFLDITPSDFREIYALAYGQALERLGRSMLAEDIMTRRVISVRPDAGLNETARIMADHGITGLPVVDDKGQVAGVLSQKDFIRLMTGEQLETIMQLVASCLLRGHCPDPSLGRRTVAAIMSAPAVIVTPDTPVARIADILRTRGINRVPVVTERDGLVGIVARSDMVRAFCAWSSHEVLP